MRKGIGLLLILLLTLSCAKGPYEPVGLPTDYYHRTVKKLTDVIVYDIFSPPVASRVYAYPNIAAYEVLAQGNTAYRSLAGQINGLGTAPTAPEGARLDLEIAALKAFIKTGKALVFSESKMEDYENQLIAELKDMGIPLDVIENSMAYGSTVSDHILAWSDLDNYKQTRTYPKYTIQDDAQSWKPTPPSYMDGIEPSWNKIRTLILDSANQFVPESPTAFNMNKDSQFYKELMEVYDVGKNLTDEQEEIAQFWDCNPYVSHLNGHAMFATKKITPGGHWIGITKIVTSQEKRAMPETVEAYTRVSIALFDAFISCWDEKWRSILIRPETLINQHIDEDWVPLLQTPPFPEYTSGHSVISTAAAATLTQLFGEQLNYTDSTEVEFGLKPRDYTSFFNASEEAAISRLYGGIHYMPAIANGVKQGRQVGDFVNANLITKTP